MKNPAEFGKAGAVNVYRCEQAGTETWTRDLDVGTTPLFIGCKVAVCPCGNQSMAMSAGYPKDIPDDLRGEWEWWRPLTKTDARIAAARMTDDAVALQGRMLTKAEREIMIQAGVEHWVAGGLFLRKSSMPWAPGRLVNVPPVPGRRGICGAQSAALVPCNLKKGHELQGLKHSWEGGQS